SLESALFQLQLGADLKAGGPGINPNLFDPLGARGFAPAIWMGKAPAWARDLQFRVEPNGDWTMQAPGEPPVVIQNPLSRALRAERLNEQIASAEARSLSPNGKVERMKELTENKWTGTFDEGRIINILRYTSADEAAQVLNGLKTTQVKSKPLIDTLNDVTQLDNNVQLHAQIAALRLRARRDDPKLLS